MASTSTVRICRPPWLRGSCGWQHSQIPNSSELKRCGFRRTGSHALSRARNYTHVTLRSRADASTRPSVSCAQTAWEQSSGTSASSADASTCAFSVRSTRSSKKPSTQLSSTTSACYPRPTAFGKTAIAAAAIAHRGRSTLILVHRRELLAQWVERLKTFLSLDASQIGTIGGGRRKPTGHIDVALVQSLVRKGEVSDLVAGYGHLIVDGCHHISASTFEMVAQRSKARYVLGLSATVTRKDGHHPIIFMQCGPAPRRSARASRSPQFRALCG
jgi:hypothetical protein